MILLFIQSRFLDGLQTKSHSCSSRWFCNKMSTTVQNVEYIYPHSIQEISKVVFEKTLSCNNNMPSTLHTIQFVEQMLVCLLRLTQHTLVINVCITDRKTTFMISTRVQVKISRFHPVTGGIS